MTGSTALLPATMRWCLPAVEAEEIDGWQINIGQESMPFRVGYGLYRTPSLAASGMPALLRHKFWLSPEKEQVQGRKFIGLLLYASERDDYRYTLQAGAELLGTVRPARRDNRRHLIVAERPIEILAGVPFTVRADGTGPCYLEKVLFLSELPAAWSFAPRLDRLSTRVTAAGTVELHGIASEPVAVSATAIPLGGAGAPVTVASGDYYPLLALPLPGVLPGQPYRIEVEAREPGGEVGRASVEVPATVPVLEAGAEDLKIPIEVIDCGRDDSTGASSCGAVAPAGMPLTFAVPLPRGALREPAARVSFAGPAERRTRPRSGTRKRRRCGCTRAGRTAARAGRCWTPAVPAVPCRRAAWCGSPARTPRPRPPPET